LVSGPIVIRVIRGNSFESPDCAAALAHTANANAATTNNW
jgi:hypothetical protein